MEAVALGGSKQDPDATCLPLSVGHGASVLPASATCEDTASNFIICLLIEKLIRPENASIISGEFKLMGLQFV